MQVVMMQKIENAENIFILIKEITTNLGLNKVDAGISWDGIKWLPKLTTAGITNVSNLNYHKNLVNNCTLMYPPTEGWHADTAHYPPTVCNGRLIFYVLVDITTEWFLLHHCKTRRNNGVCETNVPSYTT